VSLVPGGEEPGSNGRIASGVLSAMQAGARSGPFAKAAESGNARQVAFMMADTTRWDMLYCNRNTGLKAPNLDRLGKQGRALRKGIYLPARLQSCAVVYFHGSESA
jgi:hypothetical protein